MLAFDVPPPIRHTAFAARRAVAIANANWFRAMAWRALQDGQPNGALRAANARAAARIVLLKARRDAQVYRMADAALAGVAGPQPESGGVSLRGTGA